MSHTNTPYYIVTPDNDVHNILSDLSKVAPGAYQVAHKNSDGEVKYVCVVHDGHMPAKQNAEFIVRACNNVDTLIYMSEHAIRDIQTILERFDTIVQKAKQ